jgi:rRNA maturation RNase YbeY
MTLRFFVEAPRFKVPQPIRTKRWLIKSLTNEGIEDGELTYVFCLDKRLVEINRAYLNHNTLTDIITFDLSPAHGPLFGEIYISVQRVRENSAKYGVKFIDELHRVMIHGVLHLCGFKDKTTSDKMKMRKKEDAYLSLRTPMNYGST